MHNANNRAIFLCRNLKQFSLRTQKKPATLLPVSICAADRFKRVFLRVLLSHQLMHNL